MAGIPQSKSDESKMMLGFIVRRCAADIGHMPSPDEFAKWANGDSLKGNRPVLVRPGDFAERGEGDVWPAWQTRHGQS